MMEIVIVGISRYKEWQSSGEQGDGKKTRTHQTLGIRWKPHCGGLQSFPISQICGEAIDRFEEETFLTSSVT